MSNTISTSISWKDPEPAMATINLTDYPHIAESDLFRVLHHFPTLSEGGPWIAGGSLWRTFNKEPLEKCDIDVFFKSKKQFEELTIKMRSFPYVKNVISETKKKWNTLYKYHVNEGKKFNKTVDIQFINVAHYSSLAKLLNSFDFTVCQFGWDGKNFLTGKTSVDDLSKKQIVFWSISKYKSLMRHLHKYLSNGFTVSSDQTKFLAYSLNNSDCWAKSKSGDYDEDDKSCEKMKVPFNHDPLFVPCVRAEVETDGNWEGYGYVNRNRPVDEQAIRPALVEQPIALQHLDAVDEPRPRRRNFNRGVAIGGRPAPAGEWREWDPLIRGLPPAPEVAPAIQHAGIPMPGVVEAVAEDQLFQQPAQEAYAAFQARVDDARVVYGNRLQNAIDLDDGIQPNNNQNIGRVEVEMHRQDQHRADANEAMRRLRDEDGINRRVGEGEAHYDNRILDRAQGIMREIENERRRPADDAVLAQHFDHLFGQAAEPVENIPVVAEANIAQNLFAENAYVPAHEAIGEVAAEIDEFLRIMEAGDQNG